MNSHFTLLWLLKVVLWMQLDLAIAQDKPLSTTQEMRSLSSEKIQQGVPLRIEGTVLYCISYETVYCILQDETGAVFIKEPRPLVQPGMRIQISGRTQMGWRIPHIAPGADIEVIRRTPVPTPLTSVQEIRNLSLDESDRAYLVQLEGLITYCSLADAEIPFCFIQDDTGGIYFNYFHTLPEPGSVVKLTGITVKGWFAPDIAEGARITVIGKAPFPEPSQVQDYYLLRGKEDSKWVDLEGLVHAVKLSEHAQHSGLQLELATNDNKKVPVFVNAMDLPSPMLGGFVRVEGVAGGFFQPK